MCYPVTAGLDIHRCRLTENIERARTNETFVNVRLSPGYNYRPEHCPEIMKFCRLS